MTHIAFDLGLKTTGVCTPHMSDHFTCPAGRVGGDRLSWWEHTFLAILLPYPKGTIVVERPIQYRYRPQTTIDLARLHGILELTAFRQGYNYVEVSPAAIKKWATGSGIAGKVRMLAEAQRLGCDTQDHNEADAFLLWQMYDEGGVAV